MQLPNYQTSTAAQRAFELESNSLADQVVLVTGATGGLGTSLCLTCAQAGATVVMASRSEKKLEKLYDAVEKTGAPTPVIVPLQQDKAGRKLNWADSTLWCIAAPSLALQPHRSISNIPNGYG